MGIKALPVGSLLVFAAEYSFFLLSNRSVPKEKRWWWYLIHCSSPYQHISTALFLFDRSYPEQAYSSVFTPLLTPLLLHYCWL